MRGRFLRGIGILEDWDLGRAALCAVGGSFQLAGLALLEQEGGENKVPKQVWERLLKSGGLEKGTRERWHDNQRGVYDCWSEPSLAFAL